MKLVTIKWKDGSKTEITVKADTDVIAAYKPVLKYIEEIVENPLKEEEETNA